MRAAFLCQDLLPAFFGVARGGCSLSGWCLRCLRCLPVSPGVSGEIRSDFSRFSRFSRFPPALRIILFSFPVCCPPSAVFPLADRPSLSVLSRKNSFSRSETAPETRRCADFAPFYLFYSIIFCNMDLLSARVVTARTVPAMRNRMFSEESVLWPLGGVIIVACDGNLFTVTPIVLGCDAVLAGGFFLS